MANKTNKGEKKIQAQCWNCEYGWLTGSKMQVVSCPSCGQKVRIHHHKVKKQK